MSKGKDFDGVSLDMLSLQKAAAYTDSNIAYFNKVYRPRVKEYYKPMLDEDGNIRTDEASMRQIRFDKEELRQVMLSFVKRGTVIIAGRDL